MILTLIAGTALALPTAPPASDQLKIADYINVASMRATHTSGMEFDSPTAGEMSFTNVGFFALLGQFDLPGGFTWIPSLVYDYSRINVEGAGPASVLLNVPDLEDPLHRVGLPNFILHTDDTPWIYGAMVYPSINSTFDHLNGNDLFLSAAIGVGYKFSDSLLVGFGLYGADLTNDPFVIAAPAFIWEIDENWTTYFYGPRFVLRRDLGEDRQIGIEASWNGGEWSTDYRAVDAKIDHNSTRAGLIFRQRIRGELWFDLAAGYTFGNELNILTAEGSEIFSPTIGDAEGAPYIRMGVSLGSW